MRYLLSLLLATLLSLNVAYAAVSGVCDALEQPQNHAVHFGHHDHKHGNDHTHEGPAADPDQPTQLPAAADHHHAHVHPGLSMLLPDAIGVMSLGGRNLYAVRDHHDLASAHQVRLDRPPRAVLA